MSRKTPDISGVKFGRLTALFRAETKDKNHAYWNCRCDCGKTITARTSHSLKQDLYPLVVAINQNHLQ